MDFVSSMFTPTFTDEDGILFSDSLIISPLISNHKHHDDDVDDDDDYNPIITNKVKNKRKRRCMSNTSISISSYGGCCDDEQERKKIKHREIERQRRRDISSLFNTLRSLLPIQYIKGKRSSADHVLQTVNYIKILQNKIKELGEKRDGIKKRSIPDKTAIDECTSSLSSTSTSTSSSCSCVGDKHVTVVVMPCFVGVEIIISCCLGRHKSCLSGVLQMLTEEQRLDVVSCLSTRMQQRFMHTIVSQVGDEMKTNLSELKDKIINMWSQESN